MTSEKLKERAAIVQYIRDIAKAYDNVGLRDHGSTVHNLALDIERGLHESQERKETV